METRDQAVSYGVRSGRGNKSAERHYDSFARSVERSGWLDERAVALASYGGFVKGGIKLLPMALKALKRGKATLKPHHRRPGAGETKKIFERYRRSTADRRKEN